MNKLEFATRPQENRVHIELAGKLRFQNAHVIDIRTGLHVWRPGSERADQLLRRALHSDHLALKIGEAFDKKIGTMFDK